ncbi:MAG: hypothetical protein NTV03_03155 [Candidatus Nomurabacteria bacterium]|nr:hypothetical protein [Candidatus Nomurabacteria bacterium]
MNEKEIQKQLNSYTRIIGKLREAGIIRTGKVVADYGEYIASQKLKLNLATSSVNKGYDATDSKGKKYEIKTRKASEWNKPTIFPITRSQLEVVDFLIYVEFDNKWNLVRLLKIPAKNIVANNYNRVVISKDLVKNYSIL